MNDDGAGNIESWNSEVVTHVSANNFFPYLVPSFPISYMESFPGTTG